MPKPKNRVTIKRVQGLLWIYCSDEEAHKFVKEYATEFGVVADRTGDMGFYSLLVNPCYDMDEVEQFLLSLS